MAKHKVDRHKSRHRRGRRSLMSTSYGPWVIVSLIVAGVLLTIFLIVKFAVPPLFNLLGIDLTPPTPTPDAALMTPEPTPHPIANVDLGLLQKEIVADEKYLSDPMRYGKDVLFCGGTDETGGVSNKTMYLYDMLTLAITKVEGITLQNADIFQPQMNGDYLVWLDHSRSGGGYIMAKNRSTGQTKVVKQYYVGLPVITLDGNKLCWTERTGSYMDKVFLADLATGENLCVAMLEDSPFGQSDSHIQNGVLVYADYDEASSSEDWTEAVGAVQIVNTISGAKKSIKFEGYVHDPKTNGRDFVWSGGNHSADNKLYLSIGGGLPQAIAERVEGYGLGSNFVAYCDEEQLYVYVWGKTPQQGVHRRISLEGEQCVFAGVYDDTVLWFDTGLENNSRDILKYAVITDAGMEQSTQRQAPNTGSGE